MLEINKKNYKVVGGRTVLEKVVIQVNRMIGLLRDIPWAQPIQSIPCLLDPSWLIRVAEGKDNPCQIRPMLESK